MSSQHQDVYAVVRVLAEGSDWNRDSGESLADWAERTLRAAPKHRKVYEAASAAVANLGMCISALDGQDNTRPEILVAEARPLYKKLCEALYRVNL